MCRIGRYPDEAIVEMQPNKASSEAGVDKNELVDVFADNGFGIGT